MKVPFLELKPAYDELRQEINSACAKVFESGLYILGDEVERFEKEYAAYCEAQHCIGVGNGLDALHLSLLAMDVGPGDEVIVPSHTFAATWLAVSMTGATLVPVEPELDSFNLDPDLVKRAITRKTKVILPVHLYGRPAELDTLLDMARQCGIRVLEDAAQAHGARYGGRRIGSHGNVVAWSFYPSKNLGAMGDGGAITTNDEEMALRLRRLRNYGSQKKYTYSEKGVNSRLDPLQAAILRVKLSRLDRWNDIRKSIANTYLDKLADTGLILPSAGNGDHVWHLFVVRSNERDKLQSRLAASDIDTSIHYPIPVHLQQAYNDMGWREGRFPIAETMAKTVLSLPMGPHLDEARAAHVMATLKQAG